MNLKASFESACRLLRECRAVEAESLLRKLILEYPGQPDLLNACAAALDIQGRLTEAISFQKHAVSIQPESAAYHYNLGNLMRRANDCPGAEQQYLEAITADPLLPEPYHGLGSLYLAQNRAEPAEACLKKTLELRSNLPEAMHDLAMLYQLQGKQSEAEKQLRKCLEVAPSFLPSLNALGMLLMRYNRIVEAEDCFMRAMELDHGYLPARSNLAVLKTWKGELDYAISELAVLTSLAPDDADIHFNLSLALLTAGSMEEGWRQPEWRVLKASPGSQRQTGISRWNGESLAGRSMLLLSQQGYGNSFPFIGYASLLHAQQHNGFVEGQDRFITPLLARADGVAAAFSRDEPLPVMPDFQVAMLSLPVPLAPLSWPPPVGNYLNLPDELSDSWRCILSGLPGVKIGLAWAGRPQHENDGNRSIPVGMLNSLKSLSGVSWVSLQFGSDKPCVLPDLQLHDFAGMVSSFLDSAALISVLDLVITVDSAVAHLAGAMGVPVWLLLPWNPDWRWMRDRSDSPWYPSMKIFRQDKPGDWPEVLKRVVSDLSVQNTGKGGAVSISEDPQPILLIHYGDSDFLRHTIAQARYSNPRAEILLVGDENTAGKYAEVTHLDYRHFSKTAFSFAKTYIHMNSNHESFEKFCFMRWFIILELMRKRKIRQITYIDSDMMLYEEMGSEFSDLCSYDLALTGVVPPVLVNNIEALDDFCTFIQRGYSTPSFVELIKERFEAMQAAGLPGGICDMTFWELFKASTSFKIYDLLECRNDSVYDGNISVPEGFEMEAGRKRIFWRSGIPYGFRADTHSPLRFKVLHFQGYAKSLISDFLSERRI